MAIYWFLISAPLLFLLLNSRIKNDVDVTVWIMMSVITVIIIGTRYEVGGDWDNYLAHLARASTRDFVSAALTNTEPAYGFLNWLSEKLGLGIYGVNTACGALFVTGLAVFCRRQPIPWLAWLIATPYLLVVVSMGYTRQSAALGFLLLGLVCLEDKRIWRYFLLLAMGAAFHKTVLLMAPLGILVWRQNVWFRISLIVISSITLLWIGTNYRDLVFNNAAEPNEIFRLWYKYVEKNQWSSIGASYRVWMNVIPALLFFLLLKKWKQYFDNSILWGAIAIASIASVFFVGYFSTPIDRINIYLAPIQLYFWSRVPFIWSDSVTQTAMVMAVCLIYLMSFLFWFLFANHAYAWIPYKSALLM